jgi:hypothetical protein
MPSNKRKHGESDDIVGGGIDSDILTVKDLEGRLTRAKESLAEFVNSLGLNSSDSQSFEKLKGKSTSMNNIIRNISRLTDQLAKHPTISDYNSVKIRTETSKLISSGFLGLLRFYYTSLKRNTGVWEEIATLMKNNKHITFPNTIRKSFERGRSNAKAIFEIALNAWFDSRNWQDDRQVSIQYVYAAFDEQVASRQHHPDQSSLDREPSLGLPLGLQNELVVRGTKLPPGTTVLLARSQLEQTKYDELHTQFRELAREFKEKHGLSIRFTPDQTIDLVLS